MADLAIQQTALAGLTPTFSAASAGGDTFSNDGKTVLRVKNDGAASVDVTFTAQRKCNQGFLHDEVGTVAAGAEETFGPFEWSRFNDDTQKVHVSYSDATSVTLAAVRVG